MSAAHVAVAGRVAPRRRASPIRRLLLPPLGILCVLAYWELHIRVFNVPTYLVPAPSVIAQTFVEEWPTLQRNVGATVIEATGGFFIGNAVAILLAILFVHNKTMERTLFPIAVAVRTVPIIAIAPILVLLLGNGYAPKIVIAALICFFPTLVNMVRGLEAVEGSALELMRVLSATRRQILFKLRLPSSLPFLFAALKISTASSVIGAIVAEWIGADVGLGYLIVISTFEFRTGLLYATTVVASLLALGLFLAIVILEHLIVRWQPDTPRQ
ncbi:MAG TPA: ABC transporter permease [Candidatus Limnocylindria bacterium]|jgi:NitT/TauT family transport system permease protein|nr:ABC transporter permease [Candidatus Limnocylindria bacterium]